MSPACPQDLRPFERRLYKMKPGDSFRDPEIHALEWRRRAGGVFCAWRFKDPDGRWRRVSIGQWADPRDAIDANGLLLGRPGCQSVEWLRGNALECMLEGIPLAPTGAETFTLDAALELHLGREGFSEQTKELYRTKVRVHLSDWRHRPLASLTREEVRERHRAISQEAGRYAANGTMRVFRALWNRARRQYPELPECPTANVDWNKEPRRDRAIPVEHLPQWYSEVSQLPTPKDNTQWQDRFLQLAEEPIGRSHGTPSAMLGARNAPV